MDIVELESHLISATKWPQAIVIGRIIDHPEDSGKYCIAKDGEIWRVYYLETLERLSEKTFRDEADACEYLMDLVYSSNLVAV